LAQEKPSLIKLAIMLDTSPRSLQRKIAEMGLTYRHVLDEARCDSACKLLSGSELKINEVATVLGYDDAGSFTRAFERWMGLSPLAFRNSYQR